MKSTGVIKKIDELGRVVIPKELRKLLNIRDGEVLELFVDNQDIVIKKHSTLDNKLLNIKRIINLVSNNNIGNAVVINREKVLVSTIDIDLNISSICGKMIEDRIISTSDDLFMDYKGELGDYLFFVPLITDIDCVGALIVGFNEEIDDTSKKIGKFIASLIIEILQ